MISAWSVFVRIWGPRQVAVGAVILVGAVGGAAVVLGIGRGAVVLVRAGLNVAAVVFRHLQKIKGPLWRLHFLIRIHICVINCGSQAWQRDTAPLSCQTGELFC